ncbi:MAG TPA: PadR family transcriptional regulator, partial [Anaerolineaceae bacterium]|nr:PadR family transcriptional regulator [Anaerolineaceae bacterium]
MSVRNALLGLLAQRPFYGYELLAALDGIAGGH